eukprot:gene4321-6122_t
MPPKKNPTAIVTPLTGTVVSSLKKKPTKNKLSNSEVKKESPISGSKRESMESKSILSPQSLTPISSSSLPRYARQKSKQKTLQLVIEEVKENLNNSFDSPNIPVEDSKSEDIHTVTPLKQIFGAKSSNIKICQPVREVYKLVQKATGSLGGNGYNGAIYGELTVGSMQRIINYLVDFCGLSPKARFIDVGAGLGKPNFHAAQDPEVRLSIGVELEDIRWQLSMQNLDRILSRTDAQQNDIKINGGVNFILSDIDQASTMDPFTHIYMYDLGFPPSLQKSIARKFNQSTHARYLISYRPPNRVINEYLYEVEAAGHMITSMHGSGEGHTAYFYKRIMPNTRLPRISTNRKLTIPGRVISNNTSINPAYEDDEIVDCDELFFEAAQLAVSLDTSALKAFVASTVSQYISGERSRRTRKPRVITDASLFA